MPDHCYQIASINSVNSKIWFCGNEKIWKVQVKFVQCMFRLKWSAQNRDWILCEWCMFNAHTVARKHFAINAIGKSILKTFVRLEIKLTVGDLLLRTVSTIGNCWTTVWELNVPFHYNNFVVLNVLPVLIGVNHEIHDQFADSEEFIRMKNSWCAWSEMLL